MKLAALYELRTIDLPLLESIYFEADEPKSDGSKVVSSEPVKRAYQSSGKSQADIAAAVGVGEPTISRIKSGDPNIHINPSLNTLKKLKKVVGPSIIRAVGLG